MTDVFWYNTGSLFQAFNPTETIVPITDEAYIENIVDSFLPTVTAEGDVYGVSGRHRTWAVACSTTRRSTKISG